MNKMYVGNLPFSTSEEDLQELFEQYGSVREVTLIMDRDSGRPKGFGFVEMEDQSSMIEAIKKLNGNDYNGREIKVNEAKPRENRPSGGSYKKRY